jgi:trehalose 6-phosphate phosphatase
MHHILAKRHVTTLSAFACSNVVLAFDYDGTLAPIVRDPSRARLRRSTRTLLMAVAGRYPCIIISGRCRTELLGRLEGVPLWQIIGNHGLEPWDRCTAYSRRVRIWREHLRRKLPPHLQVHIEDKVYSLAIHYRRVARKQASYEAICKAIVGLAQARIVPGKAVVNIVPHCAPHKGEALEQARRLLACDTAIFVGDDHTDEDAFRVAPTDRLLSIRVGAARDSAARYYLKSQVEVDSLLRTLIRLRSRQDAI